ncbi:hypothetical protein Tco_1285920 [Tanacetum coccineum]
MVLNSPCFTVKSWLVQDQTVPGKDKSNLLIADSLLKTIGFSTHLVVYNKELAIPEQTATGKGISNPFMAGLKAAKEIKIIVQEFKSEDSKNDTKRVKVVEKIDHAFMVDTFRRPPRGDAEEEQLGFLLSRMDVPISSFPVPWLFNYGGNLCIDGSLELRT